MALSIRQELAHHERAAEKHLRKYEVAINDDNFLASFFPLVHHRLMALYHCAEAVRIEEEIRTSAKYV